MTFEERNKNRFENKNMNEFLESWPFLKTECGLRLEFLQLKNSKNLDFLNARIKRNLGSNKYKLQIILYNIFR